MPDRAREGLNPGRDLAALRERVARAGLLARQPRYYAAKMAATLALLGAAWLGVAVAETPGVQALAAVGLGVAFSQVGLLAHDAAHHQIASSARVNRFLALLLFDALTGLSLGWWLAKHDRHHARPNQEGRDPDVAPVLLAYAPEQAPAGSGFRRWIVARQAWLLCPLLLLEGFNLRLQSFRLVLRGATPYPFVEALALSLHFVVYLGLLATWFGGLGLALFVIVHHMAMGVYLGMVFVPNHVGMPILRDGGGIDALRRQVLTTRNVRPGPLVDFLFGGLNHQIEHHLFPRMARNQLGRARLCVREFCREHGVPYHETSLVGAYVEVFTSLHRAGEPLRRAKSSHRTHPGATAVQGFRESDLCRSDDPLEDGGG